MKIIQSSQSIQNTLILLLQNYGLSKQSSISRRCSFPFFMLHLRGFGKEVFKPRSFKLLLDSAHAALRDSVYFRGNYTFPYLCFTLLNNLRSDAYVDLPCLDSSVCKTEKIIYVSQVYQGLHLQCLNSCIKYQCKNLMEYCYCYF